MNSNCKLLITTWPVHTLSSEMLRRYETLFLLLLAMTLILNMMFVFVCAYYTGSHLLFFSVFC